MLKNFVRIAVVCGSPVSPLALIACKPGQIWKEAAVAGDSSAGMWLAGLPPYLPKTHRQSLTKYNNVVDKRAFMLL